MIVEAITMNPVQTEPKGAILSGYFAIVYTDKKDEAKVSDWWENG